MKYKNIREEELKNKVSADWFKQFDSTEILGNIDFTVFPKQDNLFGRTPLLWAEAKTGNFDIPTMFVQLILTIGKARTFDKTLPPAFLGAFDFKKIAFVDYVNIQDIFYLNDFNWNVTPSNHETKEFQLIKERIESILKTKTYVFDYQKDEKLLNTFIKNNVAKATTKSKIKIENDTDLFGTNSNQSTKREFSAEAKDVFDAGRELWKYYHSKPNVNVNASLYDIREYFQGRNDKGRMNSKSDDERYMELIGVLRNKLDFLADKIKPKIYEYGFLKE